MTETHIDPLQIANCASQNLNELIARDDSRMGKPAESWGLAEQMQISENLFLFGTGWGVNGGDLNAEHGALETVRPHEKGINPQNKPYKSQKHRLR